MSRKTLHPLGLAAWAIASGVTLLEAFRPGWRLERPPTVPARTTFPCRCRDRDEIGRTTDGIW